MLPRTARLALVLAVPLAGAPAAGSSDATVCSISLKLAEYDPTIGQRWLIDYQGAAITGVTVEVDYFWQMTLAGGAWTHVTLETTFPAGSAEQYAFGYTHGPVGDFKITTATCR